MINPYAIIIMLLIVVILKQKPQEPEQFSIKLAIAETASLISAGLYLIVDGIHNLL